MNLFIASVYTVTAGVDCGSAPFSLFILLHSFGVLNNPLRGATDGQDIISLLAKNGQPVACPGSTTLPKWRIYTSEDALCGGSEYELQGKIHIARPTRRNDGVAGSYVRRFRNRGK